MTLYPDSIAAYLEGKIAIPEGDCIIVNYCPECEQGTAHQSHEFARDDLAGVWERLTCLECGNSQEVCVR